MMKQPCRDGNGDGGTYVIFPDIQILSPVESEHQSTE